MRHAEDLTELNKSDKTNNSDKIPNFKETGLSYNRTPLVLFAMQQKTK